MNKKLYGVLEYIIGQGGTINVFNPMVVYGEIFGITYRYFMTEGWIGLKCPDCPPGKSESFESFEEFVIAIQKIKTNIQ